MLIKECARSAATQRPSYVICCSFVAIVEVLLQIYACKNKNKKLARPHSIVQIKITNLR